MDEKTDVEKLRQETQLTNEPTLPGYEKVLQVRIPCSVDVDTDGKQMSVQPELKHDASVDFDLYYVNSSDLLADQKLQKILTKRLGDSRLLLPSMDQGGRMVVDPNSELFGQHEYIQNLPDEDQLLGELLHRYVSIYHEVGTEDALGGHFTSVIHPETAIHGQMLVYGDILENLQSLDPEEEEYPRSLPVYYYEVRAILEERKALHALEAKSEPFRCLIEQVHLHDDEREALKDIDRDVLDEQVRKLAVEWREEFADVGREDPTYPSDVARTVRYLESELSGGREQALELLDVPREIGMHPDKWLCNILHDIESGMYPEDIPAHSSYWDTRMSADRNRSYDQLVEKFGHTRSQIIDDPQRRAFYSTHEVLTLREDELVRTWYSYEPTSDFDMTRIRYILFLQEMFYAFSTHPYVRILNNSRKPARYNSDEEQQPFYQATYQKEGVNPLHQAIEGELTSEKIGRYYQYETDDDGFSMWQWGRSEATDYLNFKDYGAAWDWIQTGATSG